MNLRDDGRVDGVEGRAAGGRSRADVPPPRKGRSFVPVDHVGRRPQLVPKKIDVELVRPADPAPRYNSRPAVPGPRLDLVLEALRRLRDVGLHLGVDGHGCCGGGAAPLLPPPRRKQKLAMAKVVGELEGKRRRSAVHVSFEGSGRGRPEGCPARGGCLLASVLQDARALDYISIPQTSSNGNGCACLPYTNSSLVT